MVGGVGGLAETGDRAPPGGRRQSLLGTEAGDGSFDRRYVGDRHAALPGCFGRDSRGYSRARVEPRPVPRRDRGVGDERPIVDGPQDDVACRRSPQRRRCPGEIVASFEVDGSTILWRCPACGDNGVTRGWEGTPWDRRPEGARP